MSTTAPTERGSISIPEAHGAIEATSHDQVDEAMRTVADRRRPWVALDVPARIDLLEELMASTHAAAEGWAEADVENKGIPPESPLYAAEGWGTGPVLVMRNLRMLRDTLREILETGRPQPPGIRTRPDGRVVVDVFPTDLRDKIMFQGFAGEVRLQKEVDRNKAEARMGRIYRPGGTDEGGLSVVLGAGNVSAIPATDVLAKLFNENRVCVLKMNPVNEVLGPHIAEAFSPLIRQGYLRIVYGGADVGAALVEHELADEVHITGSDKTHDVIVFGSGEEGERRKAERDPKLDIPISSELGNVTPVIVVPGPWSDADVEYQGHHIASMIVQNAGFNCITARMVVQHRGWNRRHKLLDAVRDSLRQAETRLAYYPGAANRWQQFTEAHPQAETFGRASDGELPWTFIPELDPDEQEALAFNREAFAGICGEVALDAPRDVPAFLDRAVEFCNETLWGTLSATILVHPKSLEDPAVEASVERALDELRYGNVVLNLWAGIPYLTMSMPWGAAPGHPLHDIESGRGWVHNTYLLEDIEKGVLRAPFRMPVTPPWFHTHGKLEEFGRAVMEMEATGNWRPLPRLVWAALTG